MTILVSEMQDQFWDEATKILVTFIVGGIVILVLFFVLVFCIIKSVMKSRKESLGSVKEGEKSVYYSGYGKAKKKTKKEKQNQRSSSKTTKVCKTCGNLVPEDLDICASCGSTDF